VTDEWAFGQTYHNESVHQRFLRMTNIKELVILKLSNLFYGTTVWGKRRAVRSDRRGLPVNDRWVIFLEVDERGDGFDVLESFAGHGFDSYFHAYPDMLVKLSATGY